MEEQIEVVVNGSARRVGGPPERRLLPALREDLNLTGTKYGCGEGQCGACTVLVDGRPVRSCITLLSQVRGKAVQTIEGLAEGEDLHPVQRAFLDERAIQCGFCTPGMILSAVALLNENPNPSQEQIVKQMNGNLCRCCGYLGILAAVQRAAESRAEGSNG